LFSHHLVKHVVQKSKRRLSRVLEVVIQQSDKTSESRRRTRSSINNGLGAWAVVRGGLGVIDQVIVSIEGNIRVSSVLGVEGVRWRQGASGSVVPVNNSLSLVVFSSLERRETSSTSDDGSSQDAANDF